MSKTEQMRLVLTVIKVALIVTALLLFFAVWANSGGERAQSGGWSGPTIVESLLAFVNGLLLLFLNSQRSRISELERNSVSIKECDLKRDNTNQKTNALSVSVLKMETHIEEIFKECNSINISLASLTQKTKE